MSNLMEDLKNNAGLITLGLVALIFVWLVFTKKNSEGAIMLGLPKLAKKETPKAHRSTQGAGCRWNPGQYDGQHPVQ
jgi:hypothetical protein